MSEYSVEKKGRLLTLIRFLDSIKKISHLTPKMYVCPVMNDGEKVFFRLNDYLAQGRHLPRGVEKHIIFVAVFF